MDDDALLELFDAVTRRVREALDVLDDWGLADTIPGQHRSDLVADEAALSLLDAAGVSVLSEESGAHAGAGPTTSTLVVVDPLDGSTNALHGIPWYATSLCALDDDGPRIAMVTNQATGQRFVAVRGGGATRDGRRIQPSGCGRAAEAIVGLSGFPSRSLGWRQFRALGAAALDLCLVASGQLDAYVDCSRNAHGPWDYLGGLLVCREAGAHVVDVDDRDLVVRGHADRRTPVAAATPELLAELLTRRRELGPLP
jgi:fructose-1,6-bisphosphatase/inositol monophosphatase family enzyme